MFTEVFLLMRRLGNRLIVRTIRSPITIPSWVELIPSISYTVTWHSQSRRYPSRQTYIHVTIDVSVFVLCMFQADTLVIMYSYLDAGLTYTLVLLFHQLCALMRLQRKSFTLPSPYSGRPGSVRLTGEDNVLVGISDIHSTLSDFEAKRSSIV
jgi:hypothetical protein